MKLGSRSEAVLVVTAQPPGAVYLIVLVCSFSQGKDGRPGTPLGFQDLVDGIFSAAQSGDGEPPHVVLYVGLIFFYRDHRMVDLINGGARAVCTDPRPPGRGYRWTERRLWK
jgi:hypothetical protein